VPDDLAVLVLAWINGPRAVTLLLLLRHRLCLSLKKFPRLHSQDLRYLADGAGTSLGVAVLDPPDCPVGEVSHPGEFPLGEDLIPPQSLQLLHIDLHSP
jgi:hypothetical protein